MSSRPGPTPGRLRRRDGDGSGLPWPGRTGAPFPVSRYDPGHGRTRGRLAGAPADVHADDVRAACPAGRTPGPGRAPDGRMTAVRPPGPMARPVPQGPPAHPDRRGAIAG